MKTVGKWEEKTPILRWRNVVRHRECAKIAQYQLTCRQKKCLPLNWWVGIIEVISIPRNQIIELERSLLLPLGSGGNPLELCAPPAHFQYSYSYYRKDSIDLGCKIS